MREVDDEESFGGGASVLALTARNQTYTGTASQTISFDRRELNQILKVYGSGQKAGFDWRRV